MKNFTFFICFAVLPFLAISQDFSRKPGKVTDYELRMTSYEKDTAAAAVILCEQTNIQYNIMVTSNRTDITQYRYYYLKGKVLRRSGTDLADFEVTYYSSPNDKEMVTSISGVAYNLTDGKRTETQLKKQYIFTEQLSENYYRVKFSVPDVREGTVFEVKYTLQSDIPSLIRPVGLQHEYPVVSCSVRATIPEYFRFNISTSGYYPVHVERGSGNGSFNVGQDRVSYREETVQCEAADLPALNNEPMVWCMNDFRTTLQFELAGYDFPGSVYQPRSSTWQSVNELLEKSNFSSNLKAGNPYKTEVAIICAATTDEMERIRQIHQLVLSRMGWNESYRLISDGVRSASGQGTGSSADINFALNAALRGAGFKTTPILLNPRRYGRLPITHPSIDKINAFVLRVTLSDGSYVYLDGTNRNSGPNVLPPALMVDRARVYNDNTGEGWVDLTRLAPNAVNSLMTASVSPDGMVTGTRASNYLNALAMSFKGRYVDAKSQEKFIEQLEEEDHLEISDYEISGLDTNTIEEKYAFKFQASTSGDFIYINSCVIPFMSRNPLSSQERTMPVEFSFPERYQITCNLEIPEGWVVEEAPKPVRIVGCEKSLSMTYMTKADGRTMQIVLRYDRNRAIYPVNEYEELRTFLGMAVTLSGSNIILKKA